MIERVVTKANVTIVFQQFFWRLTTDKFKSRNKAWSSCLLAWIVRMFYYKKVAINKNDYKLTPYGTGGRLLLTANFKVMWHKN